MYKWPLAPWILLFNSSKQNFYPNMSFHDPEKEAVTSDSIKPVASDSEVDEQNEVFRMTSSGEQYRTVSWQVTRSDMSNIS